VIDSQYGSSLKKYVVSQVDLGERNGEGPQEGAEQQAADKEENLAEEKQDGDGEARETTMAPNFDLPEDLKVCAYQRNARPKT
jgi:hypothetical protein